MSYAFKRVVGKPVGGGLGVGHVLPDFRTGEMHLCLGAFSN